MNRKSYAEVLKIAIERDLKINQLPNELLLEIFNYFDGATLKNVALVCKRWSKIIFESASTMQRLPLVFSKYYFDSRYDEDEECYEECSLTRKYHTVNFAQYSYASSFAPKKVDNSFKEIAPFIQRLELIWFDFKTYDSFKFIFENIKKLKVLKLHRVQMGAHEKLKRASHNQPLEVENLELSDISGDFLACFQSIQVTHLTITGDVCPAKDLRDFISKQKRLESIHTGDYFPWRFEEVFNFAPEFKLKTLSIYIRKIRDMEAFERVFITFLKFHEESLEHLEVGPGWTYSIHKTGTRLKLLKKLKIRLPKVFCKNSKYDALRPNTSLKDLTIFEDITQENFKDFCGILSNFPNIQKVKLFPAKNVEVEGNDVFNTLSTKLPELRDLSIRSFSCYAEAVPGDVVFPRLERLHFSIEKSHQVGQWINFITRNQSIISLDFDAKRISKKTMKKIMDLPNLRHIQIRGSFKECKLIYDAIKKNHKNLHSLKLKVEEYALGRREGGKETDVEFFFPLDETRWSSVNEFFDEGCGWRFGELDEAFIMSYYCDLSD